MRKTRNDTDFWYCLLDPNTQYAILDENGNETGEIIPSYYSAVSMPANVSPANGIAQSEMFGNLESYDKVIVTRDMECPIDENTVLFIGEDPSYTDAQTHVITKSQTVLGNDEIEVVTYPVPKYNYYVRRVAKSKNVVSIAVRKVTTS